LLDLTQFGLAAEPTPMQSLAAGADLVCFSGDKLLGGPQAGIILGKAASVQTLARHPLMRALRVDKVTLAGLIATVRHYQRGEALTHIPIWRMIALTAESLRARSAARACNRVNPPLAGDRCLARRCQPGTWRCPPPRTAI
jgi:L-seryl-tRNA(Ser) seleniumtransferase